ncbi:MAG: DUF4388 domain-containing protein [Desulfomonile tiedjei]|nr:DUF4388 domain-containing protein [Desulfomonile tiedjei]
MSVPEKRVVTISPRLAKFIGSKASREKKLQAAAMQAEFTLKDTLIILAYLARDSDQEIAEQARKNLIPAARNWASRPDRPELPEPIHEIVTKVIERVGLGDKEEVSTDTDLVTGHIGLLGLGEIIQSVDHNNRTVAIILDRGGEEATVYTERGKVIGAVTGGQDGMDALHTAFGWWDAAFKYVHMGPGPFKNRIKVNTLTLVMDALEHAPDEDPYQHEDSISWRVQGHLKVMNLFEIAEIFEMNSKQAVCRLDRDGSYGFLYFNNGRIVNAELREMTGMDAACHLLAWPNALFSIFRGGEEIEEVIHVGMQNLIIEAMRLLDEGVTVTDRIASELALVNELFDGSDVITLPVMEKVLLVFSDDQNVREALEGDTNPIVRKAIKVKISKTVHKYLSLATEHQARLKAAQGMIPMSTTEKLVLLSYLSHDESQELRERAKKTLESLDIPTFRKGLGGDLHPSVMDFLVRETIREESVLKIAASSENLLEETALYIIETYKSREILQTVLDNRKLLERCPAVVTKLGEVLAEDAEVRSKLDILEESMLSGQTEMQVQGPLSFFGLAGLIRAARHGGRSGTIVVESPTMTGRVFFKRGKVVGASSGEEQGLSALQKILKARDLKFRFTLRTYLHRVNCDPTMADELLAGPLAMPFEGQDSDRGIRLVTGSLKALDTFEILSALEGTRVPVSVTVVCEEGSGDIFRDRSRIQNVVVKGIDDPVKAMACMLSWTGIRFIIREEPAGYPVTIDKNLNDFFMEAMKQMPEELFRLTRPGEMPEWELSEEEYQSLYHRILGMGVADKVKLAFLGNKEARDILIRDSNKMVATAVIKSPKIQENEVENISKSRQVCEDVLRIIAGSKEWMKSHPIKVNLASNPKTPLPMAMKLLNQLRDTELRRLSKDKNVSQVLATQARRMLEAKEAK